MVWDAGTTSLPFDRNMAYLSGQAPLQTSNTQLVSGPTTNAESGPSGESATTPTTQQGAVPSTPSLASTSYDQKTGSIEDKLLNPLKTGLPQEQSNIQAMRQAFNQEAGPSRTWENIGGQGIFEQALSTGDTAPAKDLLGASYGGPQALPDDFATASYNIDNLYGRANALQSPTGLMGYIQTVDPSMTSGKARFQAGSLLEDEAFKSEIPVLAGQAKEARDFAAAQEKEAVDFAKQRQKEEADIAKAAREYGLGKKEELTQDWSADIAAADYDEKVDTAYKALEELSKSGQLPTDVPLYGTEAIAESDIVKGAGEAQHKWDKIIASPKYDLVEDIPPLVVTVDAHGNRRYALPDDWLNSDEGKRQMAKPNWKKKWNLAIQRQHDLEKYFDPFTENRKYLRDKGVAREEGQYSEYMPLYHTGGQQFEFSNLAPYTSLDAGFAPSYSNVSSEEERNIYNLLLDILSMEGAIQDPIAAYRDPSLQVNAEGYLGDEAARLGQWDKATTQAGKQFDTAQHEARQGYREAEGGGLLNAAKNFYSFNPQALIDSIRNTSLGDLTLGFIDPEITVSQKLIGDDKIPDARVNPKKAKTPKGAKSKSVLSQLQQLEQSGLLR
jgi:hypothetical protein